MSDKVAIRREAQRDLVELGAYLAQRSRSAAERLLRAIERGFQLLAGTPKLGGLCEFRNPALEGARVWPVRRFPKYLIFYRPTPEGIEVIRVLHGARDIAGIFEEPAADETD